MTRTRGRKTISDGFFDVTNIWADKLINDEAYPLLSIRMKELIDSHLTGEEGIVWGYL